MMSKFSPYLFFAVLSLSWLLYPSCSSQAYRIQHKILFCPSISVELRSRGSRLPTFIHRGRYYVIGSLGQNYSIFIRNRTNRRLEVVVDVDGRDVINGTQATNFTRRGYVLNPYRYVNITGYRTSMRSVAAFRFSRPSQSYAARVGSSWYRIGHIRVAVFEEKNRPLIQPAPLYQKNNHFKRSKRPYPTFEKSPKRSRSPHYPTRRNGIGSSPNSTSSPKRDYGERRRVYHPRRLWRPSPSLGTAYGRQLYAPSEETTFERASYSPTYIVHIQYDTCSGFYRRRIWSPWCRPPKKPLIQRRQFTPPPQ